MTHPVLAHPLLALYLAGYLVAWVLFAREALRVSCRWGPPPWPADVRDAVLTGILPAVLWPAVAVTPVVAWVFRPLLVWRVQAKREE